MTDQLAICVVTGTRADYGLLESVMAALVADPAFTLQLAATGMHLSPEFGATYREIESDGYAIDAKVEMLLSSDSGVGVAKSMGLATSGFADVFARLQPDMVMLLGDRFEALAAAQTALVMRIPLAHISGGDVTEGAFDDAIRHAITKMAHVHFVASEEAARRVRQLGEAPGSVHVVGDPGLDRLRSLALLDRQALADDLDIRFGARNLLVTFHPATLDAQPSTDQFAALLDALASLGPDAGLFFTRPNADPEGRALIEMLDQFVAETPNAWVFTSLGHLRYLSMMRAADVVVGNSSSGLLEAPSLGKPTVNLGSRQGGRLRAASVIDCAPQRGAIVAAIETALDMDCRGIVNPYGDGHAASRILAVLSGLGDPQSLLRKRFCDLAPGEGG
ncbi:MAG TPA: UDP-N-acetylglucosamine 2-epimerase [Alphaproteobacteria bacterium]|nr:UDP-N-acetylglucosamine 2-epimerase [Alphaproteobacteria bacterium]